MIAGPADVQRAEVGGDRIGTLLAADSHRPVDAIGTVLEVVIVLLTERDGPVVLAFHVGAERSDARRSPRVGHASRGREHERNERDARHDG